MEIAIVSVVFLTTVVVREYYNNKYVNSLLDRLMAQDFKQYKELTKPKPKFIPQPKALTDPEMAALEEARLGKQVEDNNNKLEEALAKVSSK